MRVLLSWIWWHTRLLSGWSLRDYYGKYESRINIQKSFNKIPSVRRGFFLVKKLDLLVWRTASISSVWSSWTLDYIILLLWYSWLYITYNLSISSKSDSLYFGVRSIVSELYDSSSVGIVTYRYESSIPIRSKCFMKFFPDWMWHKTLYKFKITISSS